MGLVAPLPCPPTEEFSNHEALDTIASHPDLFKVLTPIHIDHFEALLADHPNLVFVRSVCQGLHKGFWPFTNTHLNKWPITWDNSDHPLKTQAERNFIASQIHAELEADHYSAPFGPEIFLGMYSMPIHTVPKPGTDKYHLITDHSAGEFTLNNMIKHEDIAGVTLDNVQNLGNALQLFCCSNSQEELVIWKVDVSEAYRLIPMHPLWQVKQVVYFQGKCYVDHCNVFGGHASQQLFHIIMSLVIWIAVMKLLLYFLYLYVDNFFSFKQRKCLEFYQCYNKFLP
ncbi:hypothetical protein PAXRUDRAFT_169768 [Paxillus rubicundulus Ve08.2h10]|uniref:Unplaced genomic scaffold scaffold_2635, whole genome shotgun sequence n=1 Tax=Paxillus rubicundulus Ve08.2h10 TaxID=930991 RepID=A0A0D0DFI1_9AGAM|nr:hypothetical protein PAXRUDRAFT_169768 [Paxillus rubicundulus Ve08.2h10]